MTFEAYWRTHRVPRATVENTRPRLIAVILLSAGNRDLTSFQRGVRPRQGMRNVKVFGLLNGNPGITSTPEFDVWTWQGGIKTFSDIPGFETFSLVCTFFF